MTGNHELFTFCLFGFTISSVHSHILKYLRACWGHFALLTSKYYSFYFLEQGHSLIKPQYHYKIRKFSTDTMWLFNSQSKFILLSLVSMSFSTNFSWHRIQSRVMLYLYFCSLVWSGYLAFLCLPWPCNILRVQAGCFEE